MTSSRATYVKDPTGRHEVEPLHARTNWYNDFEVENGVNKRINCLVAFTVISILLAAAALTLAVLLLFQGMEKTVRDEADITSLRQQIKQLGKQAENSDSAGGGMTLRPFKDEEVPEEEPQEDGLLRKLKTPQDVLEPPSDEASPLSEDDTHYDHDDVPFPLSPIVSDDEESNYEGSGECPNYPRPVCPQSNHSLCYEMDPSRCPIPVCCVPV
ncbi:hypothetical protein OTU49_008588 [Cherax quadricarinatus]|uniref:Uncharacterized protein n=2 Tax=Cherax quadricarinatus TaxID=27406 RepID=A0AAW0YFA7_CHEQU|nr:uncharacterized protein LOC128686963 isoform X2 [Cherax quadricarinatus]